MVQEAEEKNIQTLSVDNPLFFDLATTFANPQAPGEYGAASGRDAQSEAIPCKIPDRNAMISIAMIDEHSFTRECITKSLQEIYRLLDITSFATCDECLQATRKYDLILYHAHESLANGNNDHKVLASVKRVLQIAPVIILCDVDCFDSMIAAFESGARGYIPTASTTLELAIEIIRLVRAGGTFVPPSSLSLGRAIRQGETAGAIPTFQFTPRQLEVLERLKIGKANKMIANELGMSESTVKIHIRNIMKKMKATNRTEVAALALTPWRRQEG
jgi:DNA-binding NarL/FixJ family response regulator